jgi:RND family efflux transporter MFP subunit
MVVGRENITLARQETLQVGPALSGTLEADRSAAVRAEIGGAIVELNAEPGQAVAKGAVLARIDDSGVRDGYASAQSAVRTAELAVALAERNASRTHALADAGAIADRDREQADWNLSSAQTQLANSRSLAATAEKQLARTVLRAPFTGVVSERPANLGDVVQQGTPLFTVVDPGSLKLEGSVALEGVERLRPGTPVLFTVTGMGSEPLRGRISRVNPVADPATRQIRVTVSVPNAGRQIAAGLFADGRIALAERPGVVVPAGAVDRTGLRPTIARIRGGRVERVEVTLGLLDEAREQTEIESGIAAGDTVLLGGARGLPPGTVVRVGSADELSRGDQQKRGN